MTKAGDYADLVMALVKYDIQKAPLELLAEALCRLMDKGYDPAFAADWLVKSLRDEVDRLPTFGE
ncbi:unnamed protein product [marine sediment metagenome]|uniref:Uncharacterized protein n=1 Tax=marine sediment metagenome TaxID=412755 RepID=X1Q9I1_9ZZZZ